MMTLTRATRTCLRKYVIFSGRASRSEYWKFVLFVILGGFATGFAEDLFLAGAPAPLSGLFLLAIVLPLIAAGVRRMHDTGRSGLFLFYPVIVWLGITTYLGSIGAMDGLSSGDISILMQRIGDIVAMGALFVLVLSPLIVLWWLTRPGERGDNRFGPVPGPNT